MMSWVAMVTEDTILATMPGNHLVAIVINDSIMTTMLGNHSVAMVSVTHLVFISSMIHAIQILESFGPAAGSGMVISSGQLDSGQLMHIISQDPQDQHLYLGILGFINISP